MLKSIKVAAPSYGVFAAGRLSSFQRGLSSPAAEAIAPQSYNPEASKRIIPQYLVRGTNDFLIRDVGVQAFVDALDSKGQTVMYDQVEGAGYAFFEWGAKQPSQRELCDLRRLQCRKVASIL